MSKEKISLAQHGCSILDASIGHFNGIHSDPSGKIVTGDKDNE
jgi:hypothetical protein